MMTVRRVLIPVALLLTLLVQFLPGTAFSPRPAAAAVCDSAIFVADVTIPDGTSLAPGAGFVKTWRLQNSGTCTWTPLYSVVFASGDQLGAPAVVSMPTSVAPGASVDIQVPMTAPTTNGHYRGNWRIRNDTGGLFGVGASNYLFWVDIFVNSSYTSSATYDFVANYCSATWSSGAGTLPCPGTDGSASGFVLQAAAPQLENGNTSSTPGLIVNPQQTGGGYIQGVYPAYTVQAGDRFQGTINCAYGASGCYVNYQLRYQIGSGPVNTLWSFNERYDGLYYPVNLDLSSLVGQSVNFILYVADVSGHGTPSGDRAEWVGARIAGYSSGGSIPIPPPSVCDKGAFVDDVTIPDGSVMAPGTSFTKTWRIRNVGSCTWTTSYSLVYVFGDPMGAASPVNLSSSIAPVAPGATADFSVNMVAPSIAGHYRSYWRFRNASGVQFGVGSGMITFFADIYVSGSGVPASVTSITAHNPNPSTPGQTVAVSVTVSGSGTTPTGTVAITGADTNCSITLAGGSGSCNVIFNTSGTKTLTATYGGSASYAASASSASHTVSSAATTPSTTTIATHTPNPSAPGQSVAVGVTVSGSGAVPTGTVAITGADTSCTITLASGSGSCNVVFNTFGSKTLTATYAGNASYAGSAGTASHTVNKGASTTVIASNVPNPSSAGAAVAVSVTVTGAGSAPTGTVAITGADTNCTITLAGGSGSCNAVFNSAGSKTLTATYGGDGNYNGSSGTASQTVTAAKATSTTTITGDVPDSSTPGQSVVVGVTVSGTGAVPTGTVVIAGADTNCTITLAGGSGSCNVVFNTTGAKTIAAAYSGDTNYSTSSDTESHTVSQGPSTTAITAHAPNPSIPGQSVTVSATVGGAGITPTGTVIITGADTNCTITLSSGSGSCNVVFNTVGDKSLVATYSGDMNYVGSSVGASHTVIKGPSTVTITADVPDPSAAGGTVPIVVTVSGAGATPVGTVTIAGAGGTCTITLIGGTGSCNLTFSATGTYTITATYSGDVNYDANVDTENHTVN